MEEHKSRGRVAAFFESKGFYVVLALCVAVIGVSAWLMLTGVGLEQELGEAAAVSSQQARPAERGEASVPLEPDGAPQEPEALAPEQSGETLGDGAVAVSGKSQPRNNAAPAPVLAETAPEGVNSLFVWPVMGTLDQPYSTDALLYDRTMNDWRTHAAMDIAADPGTQITAAASGTVSAVYDDRMYGTTVVLDHGGGLQSIYCGLAAQPTVAPGDGVTAGEVIGSLGTVLCESAQSPHLHFAMTLDGERVDPTAYLPARTDMPASAETEPETEAVDAVD